MSDATRVGLLFGGRSVEHEVSLVSARGVAATMRRTALECVPLAVTPRGRWLSPEVSARILDSDRPHAEPGPDEDDGVSLVPAPGRAMLLRHGSEGTPVEIDVVFPLIHGWGGEDGRMQGALDLAGIPYVGAGVLGSAVGMDKAVARTLFEAAGLHTAAWTLVARRRFVDDPVAVRRAIERRPGLPCFVKPSNGGSSIGISRVVDAAALDAALRLAFEHDRRVVVERALDAREIECAVLGNDRPRASVLGEILPAREFYDYEAKYVDAGSRLVIPAELDEATTEAIREQALIAYRALDLRGLSRVDFLVDRGDGRPYINEVNTLPGFTPISMFPRLWEASGVDSAELIVTLVDLALGRES